MARDSMNIRPVTTLYQVTEFLIIRQDFFLVNYLQQQLTSEKINKAMYLTKAAELMFLQNMKNEDWCLETKCFSLLT